jgi:hypothetical protein
MDNWPQQYIDHLPDELKPQPASSRFQIAAETAQNNEWQPGQLARVVLATDYGRARNPAAVALMRMEEHGGRKPATTRRVTSKRNPSGCIICPPGVHCPDPVTERIPADWTAERFRLLDELMTTPELTEDDREWAMTQLIEEQHRRH